MFYFLSGLIFFIFQTILLSASSINIYPELFFFPYLVAKGFLPYRDFFDHHGFLLYYLLAPFIFDRSLFWLKMIYFFIQSVNLLLIVVILKKTSSKTGFLLGGLIFVFLNYFFSDQNLWYEHFITTVYLTVFLIIIYRKKNVFSALIGLLIALSSFIKPTAALILIPVFLISGYFTVIIIFVILWALIFLFFFYQNSLPVMIDNLFFFNLFIKKHYPRTSIFDWSLLLVSFLLLFIGCLVVFKEKKFKEVKLPLIFLFFSLIFISLKYARYHLVPAATFFSITIGIIAEKWKTVLEKLFLIAVFIYLLIIINKVRHQYIFFNKDHSAWIDNKISRLIVNRLEELKLSEKPILILGERVEIYYFINKLPLSYFPLIFPLTTKYFSFFEEKMVEAMNKAKVVVVTNDSISQNILRFPKIKETLKNKYQLIEVKREYQLYFQSGI